VKVNAKMKVIITGGTGLIGRALAADLAKDGYEVILLSRHTPSKENLTQGIRHALWDGYTADGWGQLANGADAIVNLAAESLSAGWWTEKRKREITESRARAGRAVVQAVQQAEVKPKVVIQISGVGAYGISSTQVFDETGDYGDDFPAGVTRVWEGATQPVEDMGVRRVVARTGVVLSTKGGALPKMLLPFKFFAGGPLGSGQQWLPWVHLDDEVRALRFFIENPDAHGTYNIAAQPVTNRQFAHAIGKVMSRPAFFPVPAFVIRLLFGEMGMMVLEGQRVSSKKLEDLGFQFLYPDAESALRGLLTRPRK